MRLRPAITMLFLAGLGLGLSGCYYAPAPGYGYDSGYYSPGYYSPSYYAPAYYGGPSVGVYYGGYYGGHRDWDRRWR
jgi:hypothetical protein